MPKIIFDVPPKIAGTNMWDIPAGVREATTEFAPDGKMFGIVDDATGWEIYNPANYPTPKIYEKVMSVRDFIGMFTPAEYALAIAAKATDPDVLQFMDLLMLSVNIDVESDFIMNGLQTIQNAGVLSPARVAEIEQGI